MDQSEWARRIDSTDVEPVKGEEHLVDVTPVPPIGGWFLAEMADHRCEAHSRRVRTTRYATRTGAWWIVTLLPLPLWANLAAFVVMVALGVATLLEAERWLAAHLAARERL